MEENKMNQQTEEQTVDAATQSEIDRRVREAVAQARAEWEKAASDDCVRMAAMSDKQREDYALARRESALAERERRIVERELRAMAVEKLAERGLPKELADALPYADEAKCLAGLDAVEKAFRLAVQTAVDQRLRGEAPSAGGVAKVALEPDRLTDEEYYRLRSAR